MGNGIERHKTANAVKRVCAILAFIVIGVMLAGIICGWFGKNRQTETKDNTAQNNPLVVNERESRGISLMSAVAVNEAGAYSAESVTITATLKPDNTAENTGVDWSINWQNPASAWANGKAVTSYVTLSAGDDYITSKTATLTCLQPFGEQITVKATAKDNPEVTGACNVDYAQKLNDFSLSFGTVQCDFTGGRTGVILELNQNGTATGGMPTLTQDKGTTYTLEETYQVSYAVTPVETPFLYKNWSGMSDYWLDFGYATEQYSRDDLETVKEKLDRSALTGYNVSEKGLYFGIRHFRDNMGLNGYYRYYRAGGVYSFPMGAEEFENSFSPATMIESYTRIKAGGSYNDGAFDYTYSGLELFALTVTLTGNYSSHTKTTVFYMDGYTNATTINGMSLDKNSIVM